MFNAEAFAATQSEAELKAAASAAAARANAGSTVASTSAAKSRQSSAAFDEAGPSVSSVPAFGSGSLPPVKKKKVAGTFSPELQAEFDMLKREAAKGASFVSSSLVLCLVLLRPLRLDLQRCSAHRTDNALPVRIVRAEE